MRSVSIMKKQSVLGAKIVKALRAFNFRKVRVEIEIDEDTKRTTFTAFTVAIDVFDRRRVGKAIAKKLDLRIVGSGTMHDVPGEGDLSSITFEVA